MFRIKAELFKPIIDITRYRKALIAHFDAHLEEAIRKYIKAIAFNIVPVWSGASVATFLKLASLADYPLQVRPRGNTPDGTHHGFARSGADIEMDLTRGRYHFIYQTSLPHLIFNEYNNANEGGDPNVFHRLLRPGPYNFQGVGAAVFVGYARTVRMPNPYEYLRITKKDV